jgi:hypothetical protein
LIQAIVPELIPSPQPLPAFIANGCGVRNFQGRQPSRAIPDALLAAERIIGIILILHLLEPLVIIAKIRRFPVGKIHIGIVPVLGADPLAGKDALHLLEPF